jgi:extracellular factor (EF) 3-hydroxypalmitic acid methyl ester biosynthesis protein
VSAKKSNPLPNIGDRQDQSIPQHYPYWKSNTPYYIQKQGRAMKTDLQELENQLKPAMEAFARGEIYEAVDYATETLSAARANGGPQWRALIPLIRSSKLAQIGHMCPFTQHAYSRPRGYPGDALLLDWIYRDFRINRPPADNSLSAMLYRRTNGCAPSTAVRWRKQHLAHLIDDIAATKPNARVLAVAAGHLREADVSNALQRGKLRELVALDQDPTSLEEIEHCYVSHGLPITTVCAPIKSVITGRYKVEDFDLIYSAGLYDYLDPSTASALTARLFDGLNPGGKLVVTNFLHGTPDLGWMEALMDWFLIYRTPDEIKSFANRIPEHQIDRMHGYKCPTGCVGYLGLRRI